MATTNFPPFDSYVCPGDTVTCERDGFTLTARLEYDQDSGPPDQRSDGFWPSLDPKAAGYIGPKSKTTLARHMAHARQVMDGWKNDEWFYCGVVLSVEREGVMLVEHAASLWCIEANYPVRDKRRRNLNNYVTEVANDMLDEALGEGRRVLTKLFGDTNKEAHYA